MATRQLPCHQGQKPKSARSRALSGVRELSCELTTCACLRSPFCLPWPSSTGTLSSQFILWIVRRVGSAGTPRSAGFWQHLSTAPRARRPQAGPVPASWLHPGARSTWPVSSCCAGTKCGNQSNCSLCSFLSGSHPDPISRKATSPPAPGNHTCGKLTVSPGRGTASPRVRVSMASGWLAPGHKGQRFVSNRDSSAGPPSSRAPHGISFPPQPTSHTSCLRPAGRSHGTRGLLCRVKKRGVWYRFLSGTRPS